MNLIMKILIEMIDLGDLSIFCWILWKTGNLNDLRDLSIEAIDMIVG